MSRIQRRHRPQGGELSRTAAENRAAVKFRVRGLEPDVDWYQGGGDGRITVRDAPLERAQARRVILDRQYSAGDKYRLHWFRGGMAGVIGSVNFDRVGGAGNGHSPTEDQVFHRQQWAAANQVVGKVGGDILEMVICRETKPEMAGYYLGATNRAQAIERAWERLRAGLDTLCGHWSI